VQDSIAAILAHRTSTLPNINSCLPRLVPCFDGALHFFEVKMIDGNMNLTDYNLSDENCDNWLRLFAGRWNKTPSA
jgi:hypothetical protein